MNTTDRPPVALSNHVQTVTGDITERLYGNGKPRWERQLTALDAALDRLSLVKRLKRKPFPKLFPGSEDLAGDLHLCEPKFRCGSAACPECARAAQKWLTEYVRQYCEADVVARVEDRRPNISYVATTVVPPGVRAQQGELSKKAMSGARKQLRETLLGLCTLEFGVFAYDFSLNDDTGKDLGIDWQPHFHGILGVTDTTTLEDVLRKKYPKTDEVAKPVMVTDYDISNLGASYVFKPNIMRRSTYEDTGNPNRHPFWNTKPFQLRARPRIEIALLLDFMKFDKRLMWLKMPTVEIRFCKDGNIPPDTP
jgi:hypothetical protein